MFAKMLIAWAAIVICLSVQGQSQIDPLASDIFTLPEDMRRTSSQDTQTVHIDPYADPLGIDPLMRLLMPIIKRKITPRQNISFFNTPNYLY